MPEPLILKVVTGNDIGRQITIPVTGAVLGRDSDCDISLDDYTISRKHCRFTLANGAWLVRDLDSSSGTIVNGRFAKNCPLKRGDELRLGQLRLRVVTISATQEGAKPSRIRIRCQCGRTYVVAAELAGKRVICKQCGGKIAVPAMDVLKAASSPSKAPLGGHEMAIRFSCPCGQKLKMRGGTGGRRVKCTSCETVLRVPDDGLSTYETVAAIVSPHTPSSDAGGASRAVSTEPKTAEASAAEPAKRRILVADSSDPDRRWLAQVLRAQNYIVLEAENGPKALELIRAERPAAAVLNVKLDIMSGFQVVQQLRSPSNPKNQEVWDTPVLMTSERLFGRDRQYALSIGAHGYFLKPLQAAQICSKLERIAAKYHPH
jgi:CheY-like chemotaxis protein/ribosomal protein S27E